MKNFLLKAWLRGKNKLLGRKRINSLGRGEINIIDVGSSGGLFEPWASNAHKIKHLLNFEPRDKTSGNPNVISLDVALWDDECERDFYIYKGRRGSGSSLLKQNVDYVRKHFERLRTRGPADLAETWFERSELVNVEKIQCTRLDNVLNELDPKIRFHLLKIDAQGAEYRILKGAQDYLQRDCLALHLELFVIPLYEDAILLNPVEEYLAQLGFTLAKKYPAHGTFDSQHDCVFIKEGSKDPGLDVIKQVYDI